MGLAKPPKECLVCLNSIETIFVPNEESQKIFNICCSYVKDAINIEFLINNINGNNNQLSFCKTCFQWSLNISQLVEQLSKLKKQISDLASSFSETIKKQRIQAKNKTTIIQFENQDTNFCTSINQTVNLDTLDRHLVRELPNCGETNSILEASDKSVVIGIDEIGLEIVKTEGDGIFLESDVEISTANESGYNFEECESLNSSVIENEIDPLGEIEMKLTTEIVNNYNIASESKSRSRPSKLVSSVTMPNIVLKRIAKDVTMKSGVTLNSIKTSHHDKPGFSFNKNRPGVFDPNCKSKTNSASSKQQTNKRIKRYIHHCSVCPKSFYSTWELKRHDLTHTGEKPYKCDQCEKTFRQSTHLQLHQRNHTGEKPYKCSYCQSSFVQLSLLKLHMRVHTGEKPYECSYCKLTFKNSASLKDHENLHTGEKPFKCQYCELTFQNRWAQRTHRKKAHSDMKRN